MMKKIIYGIIIFIVLSGIGYGVIGRFSDSESARYQFTEITRGGLENIISSTGTITPVTMIEIGTQVSGSIARVFVDFNDMVQEGQLLAVLDTVLLKASVLDAEAGVERAEAQLEQALVDYERNQPLHEKELISEAEFLPISINVKTQRAVLKSAKAALQRAERNLKYAVIRSPIDGIVVERNVEAGQTVAASFSTPTLFLIAKDLSQMKILVDVDESDIGQIKEGQSVRFEVQAYPNKIFNGTVTQVRLQPVTISNVVNYTVVVDAVNDENLLLPGMTATVDFIIEQRKDIMLVSKAALRFQPSEKEIIKFQEKKQKQFESLPDSIKEKRRERMGNNSEKKQKMGGLHLGGTAKGTGRLWYLDDNGNLVMEPVRTGMTDGRCTEIVKSRNLKEGMQVISGIGRNDKTKDESNRNANRALGGRPPRSRPF